MSMCYRMCPCILSVWSSFCVHFAGWIEVAREEELCFSMVAEGFGGEIQVARTLVIHQDCTWHVCLERHRLSSGGPLLSALPQCISSLADSCAVIEFLDSCVVCSGNSDDKFGPLIAVRKGTCMNASGINNPLSILFNAECSLIIGTKRMAFHDAMHSTIHSDGCEILVSSQSKLTSKGHRCHMCGKYRHTLNRMLFRAERSDVWIQIGVIPRTIPTIGSSAHQRRSGGSSECTKTAALSGSRLSSYECGLRGQPKSGELLSIRISTAISPTS